MLPDDVQTMFDLIGLRPIMVEELSKAAILLPDHGLVLVCAGMGDDSLRETVNRCLAAAVSDLRARSPLR